MSQFEMEIKMSNEKIWEEEHQNTALNKIRQHTKRNVRNQHGDHWDVIMITIFNTDNITNLRIVR